MLFRVNVEEKSMISKCLYVINKMAKGNTTEKFKRVVMPYSFYDLKHEVIEALYCLGEIDIIGYHILYHETYYDSDDNEYITDTMCGVLVNICGCTRTFHCPVWIEDIEGMGIEFLGEMGGPISSEIVRREGEQLPTGEEAYLYLENWLKNYNCYKPNGSYANLRLFPEQIRRRLPA